MFFLLQLPTDPPASFAALQWVMVGMLTAALVYVFRQWQNEKKNCVNQDRETIDRLMAALHNQLESVDELDISDMK